uniref:Leucine--tRNA ligase n=1 Tax=Anthurium amnicola TaxID=1678845 RepID=A0A1D1XQ74_9ARAE
MGNFLSPCLFRASKDTVKLVFWGGATRLLSETQLAGKLMFEFPDHIVCHADSFYIGRAVPVLGIQDDLLVGDTYFVIPIDRLPCHVLTAASLSTLSAGPKGSAIDFGECPFEYVKGADGKMLIKVAPHFMERIMSSQGNCGDRKRVGCSSDTSSGNGNDGGALCSTPELQKHYAQLVSPRSQQWSPKLETISECKARLSPRRLLGLG